MALTPTRVLIVSKNTERSILLGEILKVELDAAKSMKDFDCLDLYCINGDEVRLHLDLTEEQRDRIRGLIS